MDRVGQGFVVWLSVMAVLFAANLVREALVYMVRVG